MLIAMFWKALDIQGVSEDSYHRKRDDRGNIKVEHKSSVLFCEICNNNQNINFFNFTNQSAPREALLSTGCGRREEAGEKACRGLSFAASLFTAKAHIDGCYSLC